MKIRDIMTTQVTTAEPDATLETVATLMKDEDVGAIPIVDGDELCGIVTDRDIVLRCIAEGLDARETTAEEILSGRVETVDPDSDAEAAAELMSRHQVRRLPVVKEGQLVGMVSIGDIAVKQHDDNMSGDTLEGVSRGVKSLPKPQSAAKRRASEAGAHHNAAGEMNRKARVVPFRKDANTARSKSRRRAG